MYKEQLFYTGLSLSIEVNMNLFPLKRAEASTPSFFSFSCQETFVIKVVLWVDLWDMSNGTTGTQKDFNRNSNYKRSSSF